MAWEGKVETVAVTAGSTDVIDTITIQQGATNLWMEIANDAHQEFDAFDVQYQIQRDGSFNTIANASSDFTTNIELPVVDANIDLISLAKSTSGVLWLYVKGVFKVRVRASAAAGSDTTVNLYWGQR